jgi:hypothetical protein
MLNIPSSQGKSNSAAIRGARYELMILEVWSSDAPSWFGC